MPSQRSRRSSPQTRNCSRERGISRGLSNRTSNECSPGTGSPYYAQSRACCPCLLGMIYSRCAAAERLSFVSSHPFSHREATGLRTQVDTRRDELSPTARIMVRVTAGLFLLLGLVLFLAPGWASPNFLWKVSPFVVQ